MKLCKTYAESSDGRDDADVELKDAFFSTAMAYDGRHVDRTTESSSRRALRSPLFRPGVCVYTVVCVCVCVYQSKPQANNSPFSLPTSLRKIKKKKNLFLVHTKKRRMGNAICT